MENVLRGRPEDIPDIYADSVRFGVGAYGITMEFGLVGLPDAPGSETPSIKRLVRIRMSPQHALVMAKLFVKNIKAYEQQVGPIALPQEIYQQLGINKEGW